MGLVRIHCYGCTQTIEIGEDMDPGRLTAAGWALHKGETYCPACATARGLEVDAPPGETADRPPTVVERELQLFPRSAAFEESRNTRSWRLLRASLSVLRDDPNLVVFPAIAVAASLAIGAICFKISLSEGGPTQSARRVMLVAGLIASYPITFVSLYCSVALAAVLGGRLDGRTMSAGDGWAAARERIGIIAAWTLVSCTVGAVLRLLEEYASFGGKIVFGILGFAWSLATMFAVPILAYERLGPMETFRRSSEIFKRRWGTQIGGSIGIGFAGLLVAIPLAVLLAIGLSTQGSSGTVLCVLAGAGLFALVAVQTALGQIFRVFVYRSAIGQDVSNGPFALADLQAPFTRRGRRW